MSQDRHAALRKELIKHATESIAADGLLALKARDVAGKAGCSVGTVYNVFDDLTGLALAVNMETFNAVGAQVTATAAEDTSGDPVERLIALSRGYLIYARENPKLWRALFDIAMSRNTEVPQDYLQRLAGLFGLISAPLREIYPDAGPERIDTITRALYSSIHGIVLLGVEQRISSVETDKLEEMIEFVLRNATSQK